MAIFHLAAQQRETERQREFMALLGPVLGSLDRFAQAMARDRDEARDLVAETLMIAWERFDTIVERAAFLSFLFTIAHRTCRRLRSRRERFSSLSPGDEQGLASQATPPDVSADIVALRRAMELLPVAQREAVALVELSGLSLEEVRAIQGGTLSGVKARVVRGRRKLAALLAVDDSRSRDVRSAGSRGTSGPNEDASITFSTAGSIHG